ncbi:hypothetical protein ABZW11_29885 [Nonomuraea sp. NPDC004580]|uniref:hypothetical protein n=1 Tax=Nonomuraea sp. NPDC004580 TaxID=3154552 RepID=UPI0033B20B84
MRTISILAALTAAPIAAATLTALPAHAAPTCPAPSKAELKGRTDKPAKGKRALKGVRVAHLPKGFTYGELEASKHDGVTEYAYRWSDDRDATDRAHRSLWVRVVCWPEARDLKDLRKLPVDLGTFTSAGKPARLGGRKVLGKTGDGALGHGRYVGWVARSGVVVTVMAGEPLVRDLPAIVKGIRV